MSLLLRFYVFFKIQKRDFTFFALLNCCIRFLEQCRTGNACVRTCNTKTKIEPKLKRKCQRKTKTNMILRTKKTLVPRQEMDDAPPPDFDSYAQGWNKL